MEDQKFVEKVLEDKSLRDFIYTNLRQSLGDMGFSNGLLDNLFDNFLNLNISDFCKKHSEELNRVFTIGFFQDIVPRYFTKQVLPAVKSCEKIIDVGCGTGILAKLLNESGKFKQIMGIDINSYPEWEIFEKSNVVFQVVKEVDFPSFLKKEKPDSIVLTWTLHHMEFEEQERYMKYIYQSLKPGAQIAILEDSYSDFLPPEKGQNHYEKFMKWSIDDRHKIMAVQDWLANRVLAQRSKVPIPFGYRTLEEWEVLFNKVGFKTESKKFIGFPKERDINNPQSLIVISR